MSTKIRKALTERFRKVAHDLHKNAEQKARTNGDLPEDLVVPILDKCIFCLGIARQYADAGDIRNIDDSLHFMEEERYPYLNSAEARGDSVTRWTSMPPETIPSEAVPRSAKATKAVPQSVYKPAEKPSMPPPPPHVPEPSGEDEGVRAEEVRHQPEDHGTIKAEAFCRKCGAQLTRGSVFCSQCGAKVASVARESGPQEDVSPKSRLATSLLAIFLGGFGAHRFYVGKVRTAVAMLTLGVAFLVCQFVLASMAGTSSEESPSPTWSLLFCIGSALGLAVGIWAIIDLIKAVRGNFKDSHGKPIRKR
jgi:hypothetical protein